MKNRHLVGLDIGTTKIATIIGEMTEEGLQIVGVGMARSEGLRRGRVVNLEKTSQSILQAVKEAERMAGIQVRSVLAGIAGDHIQCLNSRGVIAISPAGADIARGDVQRAIEAASAVAIPQDREILHVLPQEFMVDDQKGVKDPLGLSGVRLEVGVHVVTGAVTSAQNVVKAIQRSGYEVEDLVLEPLASSYSVLTPEEEELGVVLLDMGGGTTDLLVYYEGAIRHTCVIGLGGDHVTKDVAIGLRIPTREAEKIKEEQGAVILTEGKGELISLPGFTGQRPRAVTRELLVAIIRPRMEEILSLVRQEIKRVDYAELLGAGVVLTGGAASLRGTVEMAEDLFEMPVRLGRPQGVGGLTEVVGDPRFATGVGLILFGAEHLGENGRFAGTGDSLWWKIRERMGEWIKDFF